ncbi:TetR/AcrR family transcriptional regulator [Oleomonas cavernae]|uniref:TetR/AcrR family transcriptional regulator n=1 Tax=Oleomonas cavernae TaxID=2320859 RepID=A0A418WDF9_9PROT|nr:TetR/AcrR family transcriptional regulator [Oleomonas cavernae]RJF88077.1 TetR/AcrR family transcriptional regulator [Oleomonas cavernae]
MEQTVEIEAANGDGPRGGRIRERNRLRIIAAAEKVFAERGFDGATTAQIAEAAGLAKSNVHYYFGTKEAIYRAVVAGIVELWLKAFGDITQDDDPAVALTDYIRRKLVYSRKRPLASRIFAIEIIRGAPILKPFLEADLKPWVEAKAGVLERWAAQGKMDPVPAHHFFFLVWAATQTYADFAAQMTAVLGRKKLSDADFETATRTITRIVLKGCGIKPVS